VGGWVSQKVTLRLTVIVSLADDVFLPVLVYVLAGAVSQPEVNGVKRFFLRPRRRGRISRQNVCPSKAFSAKSNVCDSSRNIHKFSNFQVLFAQGKHLWPVLKKFKIINDTSRVVKMTIVSDAPSCDV
jgi:hypothetical protein